MDAPLNKKQLSVFRDKLKKRYSELTAILKQDKPLPVQTEGESQDFEISYVVDLDQEVGSEIDAQHALEMRNIEAALQRMNSGQYGVCMDCGTIIGVKRLTAYPAARRCIECKQVFEEKTKIS